jgi:hypothetical protein
MVWSLLPDWCDGEAAFFLSTPDVLVEATLSCAHASSPVFHRERQMHTGLPEVPQFAV